MCTLYCLVLLNNIFLVPTKAVICAILSVVWCTMELHLAPYWLKQRTAQWVHHEGSIRRPIAQ